MQRAVSRVLVFVLALAALARPAVARAQDGWLADPLVPWNAPGMAIPPAPTDASAYNDELCARSIRSPETPEDEAVAMQGWTLFGWYEAGWGLKVIGGTDGFDGMCRPYNYQYFVFADGAFAGTISPVPMVSRTTGAGRILAFDSDRRVTASYVRYAPEDPLCCPSRPAVAVEFQVQDTETGPVLVPTRVIETG